LGNVWSDAVLFRIDNIILTVNPDIVNSSYKYAYNLEDILAIVIPMTHI